MSYNKLHQDFLKCLNEIDFKQLKIIEDLFLLHAKYHNNKIYFVGNGGSAAICSHMAIDYAKNCKIKSIAFNDASLLTCLSNDLGFENLFSNALKLYAEQGDILVAISSSGKSIDIINAIKTANDIGMQTITFSGFDENNDLKKLGNINVYVNSNSYRIVEIIHEYCLHTILDNIILNNHK